MNSILKWFGLLLIAVDKGRSMVSVEWLAEVDDALVISPENQEISENDRGRESGDNPSVRVGGVALPRPSLVERVEVEHRDGLCEEHVLASADRAKDHL